LNAERRFKFESIEESAFALSVQVRKPERYASLSVALRRTRRASRGRVVRFFRQEKYS